MAIRYKVDEKEITKGLKYKVDGIDIEIVVNDEPIKPNEETNEEDEEDE